MTYIWCIYPLCVNSYQSLSLMDYAEGEPRYGGQNTNWTMSGMRRPLEPHQQYFIMRRAEALYMCVFILNSYCGFGE